MNKRLTLSLYYGKVLISKLALSVGYRHQKERLGKKMRMKERKKKEKKMT